MAALAIGLLGCAEAKPSASPMSSTSSAVPMTTAPTSTAPATSSTIAPVPDGCTPAPAEEVAAIEHELNYPAMRLGEAFVDDKGGNHYLMANIYPATGDRLSSADVWMRVDGQWYALSSDARKRSTIKDGRDLPGSGGADRPATLEPCLTNSIRAENGAPPLGQ